MQPSKKQKKIPAGKLKDNPNYFIINEYGNTVNSFYADCDVCAKNRFIELRYNALLYYLAKQMDMSAIDSVMCLCDLKREAQKLVDVIEKNFKP